MGRPKTESTTRTRRRKDRAKEIANTFEWLITAFILAFVFRAFVMEAFRIPTGSMADTLKGAHWRLRCPQCGYRYDRGFSPRSVNLPPDTIPSQDVILQAVKCPSCGFYQGKERRAIAQGNARLAYVDNGDRILVLKCLYQFIEPKRWDVIVFKNPSNPAENYIKRLVALPDEKIEIIDGDLYINDRIARKPRKVQNELWMPIYENDYQPINPEAREFNRSAWENPLSVKNSAWRIRPEDPTRLHLDTRGAEVHRVHYRSRSANDFRATYAYNRPSRQSSGPVCSDLMVRFYVETRADEGRVGAVLSKYGVEYQGWVDLEGRMTLARTTAAGLEVLESRAISAVPQNRPTRLQFENVDHLLTLTYGQEKLQIDLTGTIDAANRHPDAPPEVYVTGAGKLTLGHVSIYRDIHYTSTSSGGRSSPVVRGGAGTPFQLKNDEFFVMGDNSPNSLDARWWESPRESSRGQAPPRAGIVPRDYLVGKAMFVYWPTGFKFPWPKGIREFAARGGHRNGLIRLLKGIINLKWIPNVGQMRYIYGGTADNTARHAAATPSDA